MSSKKEMLNALISQHDSKKLLSPAYLLFLSACVSAGEVKTQLDALLRLAWDASDTEKDKASVITHEKLTGAIIEYLESAKDEEAGNYECAACGEEHPIGEVPVMCANLLTIAKLVSLSPKLVALSLPQREIITHLKKASENMGGAVVS